MDLTLWKPFGELGRLRRDMDSLWDRFYDAPRLGGKMEDWMPSVDISETKDKILVKADLPGLEVKDIDINITGDILTIKGEKKKEKEEKDEHHHFVERYEGTFQRTFRLPVNVDTAKADAQFEKGVLSISLPKTEESKQKEIKIKVK